MKAQEIIEKLQNYNPNQDVEFIVFDDGEGRLVSCEAIYHTNEIAENEIGSFVDIFNLENQTKAEMINGIRSQNLVLFEISF